MRKLLALLFCLYVSPVSAQIVNTLPFQLQNGTTADATQVMADFNQIVNNTNSNAAKNGANSDITSLTGLTTPLGPSYGGSSVYTAGTSTGTANAQVVASPSPTGFTLAAGKRVVFLAGTTNTGATTLNVNSTGATNVFYPTPSGPLALTGGEIKSGNIVEVWYDGTQYQLITNNLAILGPLTNATSAATVDLGLVATHNVNVTGATGPITSFGSSASTAYPIYYLTFVSTPTITYNAASMILPGAADIVVVAGDSAVVQYLGSGNWKVWSYQRASGASVIATTPLCGANVLVITNNAGTPNTLIDYTATTALMVNSSGVSKTASTVSGTINTTNVGVIDGIQAARTTSIWYDIYFLSNGTTTGGFAVPAGTALSAPAGYTYSCRMGAMQTDSSGNFFRTKQVGNIGHWVGGSTGAVIPCQIVTGIQGTYSSISPTLVSATVMGNGFCAPATATSVHIVSSGTWKNGTPSGTIAAPSAAYSGANNGPEGANGILPSIWVKSGDMASVWIVLESTAIYVAANNAGGAFLLSDWKDSVNAN